MPTLCLHCAYTVPNAGSHHSGYRRRQQRLGDRDLLRGVAVTVVTRVVQCSDLARGRMMMHDRTALLLAAAPIVLPLYAPHQGAMTTGYATDATDSAVHANIVAAGYGA